ncbi:MAG: UDP-N-acetylmuramoyl-tripeptide--D-alanyl-D-alanine ligase [Bacteroidota bacterium]|jgi:UDP-N-acetylmuramoyl-tripeptide--D-alanyl-D-alanine ligase
MTLTELYDVYLKHPEICTDTRSIKPGSIFFALKGPRFNANTFASQAIQAGAAYAVIDEPAHQTNERCILVNDVLHTLQQLAAHHRSTLNIPVVAIVGSNGKTTTKELITSVLCTRKKVLATPGNFNNHIGLPLTLLMLTAEHDIAVIEMGANHIGENAFLCDIAKPDCGLITNNGKDHLEGFGSIEGVAQSNSELYYYLLKNGGTAFVNANDEWLMRMATRLTKKITYAANDNTKHAAADVTGMALHLQPNILFTLNETKFTSHLSGDYNFDNIMAAVCIGRYFNLSVDDIRAGIAAYEPKNNRSQIVNTSHNTVFMDAYNANPSSMQAALKNFAAMPYAHKVAILGDMFELGEYADAEHKGIIAYADSLKFEYLIFVGKEFARHKSATHIFCETTEEAAEFLKSASLQNKHIFMKGSRGIQLEKLLPCL